MEMAQTKLTALALLLLVLPSCGPRFEWRKHVMDGHMTGVTAVAGYDYNAALGRVDSVYTAPNGRVFDCGATPAVAKLLLDVQPDMAYLKEILAHSSAEMRTGRPESDLGNWSADALKLAAESIFGYPVDMSIINLGGIRVTMPDGEVLLDDIVSMFPFKNYICCVSIAGTDIRYILDFWARRNRPEAIGGARFTIRDGKAADITVAGKALDDERLYRVATVDFLLDGGDSLYVARNARALDISDVLVRDWMVPYVRSYGASGVDLEYKTDGRITVE